MSASFKFGIARIRKAFRRLLERQPFRALIAISLDFYRAQAILGDRSPTKPHKPHLNQQPQEQHG